MRLVLKSVFAACSPSAAETGVSLKDARVGPEDSVILADAGRVNQVLINLVGNAIKFSPPGSRVTVETTLSQGDGHLHARCRVADAGIGVPDSAKGAIFEAFHQALDTTQTSRGGVGLGLHIAKTLTELMGGALSVRDNPGGGAVFEWSVRFPLAPVGVKIPTTPSVQALIDSHRAGLHRLRLLVIDDQDSNRRIMKAMLERAGHTVTLAESVDAGIAHLGLLPFDAVFVDLHLPGRDGFDFLRTMADQPHLLGHAALVVISADTFPDVVERTRASGAAAFLGKPVSPAALLEVLTTVSGQRLRDGAQAATPADAMHAS